MLVCIQDQAVELFFGNLIPFGKVWRTGVNENTTISLVMML
jgi:low affinity Fe/Cu permease